MKEGYAEVPFCDVYRKAKWAEAELFAGLVTLVPVRAGLPRKAVRRVRTAALKAALKVAKRRAKGTKFAAVLRKVKPERINHPSQYLARYVVTETRKRATRAVFDPVRGEWVNDYRVTGLTPIEHTRLATLPEAKKGKRK